MSEFKIGDKVEWRSQSHGNLTTKEGKIVRCIRAGHLPKFGLKRNGGGHGAQWGNPRNHKSYLVKVGEFYYWPLVSNLSHTW